MVVDLSDDAVEIIVSAGYVWHTELGFATYYINTTKPAPPPGPAAFCNPRATPAEMCPGGKVCPNCGTAHCKCP